MHSAVVCVARRLQSRLAQLTPRQRQQQATPSPIGPAQRPARHPSYPPLWAMQSPAVLDSINQHTVVIINGLADPVHDRLCPVRRCHDQDRDTASLRAAS